MQKETLNPPNKSQDLAFLAIRLILGALFTVAGFFTLMEPSAYFAATMEAYNLIPASWTLPIAYVMPWAEFLLGGFLLFGYFTRVSLAALTAFLALFVTAIASVKLRGINLDNCGCFGEGFHMNPTHTLMMDTLLLIAGLWALRVKKTPLFSLDSWIEKGH